MKNTGKYADFVRGLAGREPARVYLFTGTEGFLKREALRRVVERVLPPETRVLNFQSFIGPDCGWGDVETACRSAPLFSETRVVALTDVDLMGEADVLGLVAYARKACESTCLVVVSSSQRDDSRRRGTISVNRVVSGLTGPSEIYSFWREDARDTHVWTQGWLRENRRTMKSSLVNELLDCYGDSCYEVWNVLEKTAARTADGAEITAEDVSSVGGAASVGRMEHFRLAVATANRKSAHGHASKCLGTGLEPTFLLWALNRSFRDALRVSSGLGGEKLNWKDMKVIDALGSRFSEREMCQAISFLYETERGIKTGVLDPVVGLERLINELTG